MKNRITILATIVMLCFGGYIGYMTNYTEKATAHELVIPRFTDIPRNNLNLDINLNKNVVSVKGNDPEQNIEVTIHKKDSIIYIDKPFVVEKEVPKYIRIRELPPVARTRTSCKDVLTIKQSEKINLSRN